MPRLDAIRQIGMTEQTYSSPPPLSDWIKAVGAKTAYIEPGSPWENGYCESFNARFRDEFLDGEIFYSLREAQILIENWRQHYNTKRPHSALGYRPPAPETIIPMQQRLAMHEHLNRTNQVGLINPTAGSKSWSYFFDHVCA